jgi:hypothetical protein
MGRMMRLGLVVVRVAVAAWGSCPSGGGPFWAGGLEGRGMAGDTLLSGCSSDRVGLGHASLYGTLLDGYPSGVVSVGCWIQCGTLLGGHSSGFVGG